MTDLLALPARGDDGSVTVVVETPMGSRAKLRYDPDRRVFEVGRTLVLGASYPYDWGFVPGTRAEDGDPLDAMIYHDVGTYPGVVVACRPIGVVLVTQKAEKENRGKKGDKHGRRRRERNDRLIVVPTHDQRYDDARRLHPRVREELEHFFLLATAMTGKKVRIEGWEGPAGAERALRDATR